MLFVHYQGPTSDNKVLHPWEFLKQVWSTHHCSVIKPSLLLDPWTAKAANSLTPQRLAYKDGLAAGMDLTGRERVQYPRQVPLTSVDTWLIFSTMSASLGPGQQVHI